MAVGIAGAGLLRNYLEYQKALARERVEEDLAEGMRQVGSIYRPQEGRGGRRESVKELLRELLKEL